MSDDGCVESAAVVAVVAPVPVVCSSGARNGLCDIFAFAVALVLVVVLVLVFVAMPVAAEAIDEAAALGGA